MAKWMIWQNLPRNEYNQEPLGQVLGVISPINRDIKTMLTEELRLDTLRSDDD